MTVLANEWNELLDKIHGFFVDNPESIQLSRKKQYQQFKGQNPETPVSLKRFKKAYNSTSGICRNLLPGSVAFPDINDSVKCEFIPTMGKGLFAKADVGVNSMFLFEENPLVFWCGWSWKIHYEENEGLSICESCAKPLVSLSDSSSASKVLIKSCRDCNAKFCNKDCLKNAMERGHVIECSKQCPDLQQFYSYTKGLQYDAPVGALKMICHGIHCEDDLEIYDSFARVSEAEKSRIAKSLEDGDDDDIAGEVVVWKKCYDLLVRALGKKYGNGANKAFEKFLSSYESFLMLLGLWSLNSYGGGIYVAQSCLNHSCNPNVVVDHPLPSTHYRILLKTTRPIQNGEQLLMSYINDSGPEDYDYKTRQKTLAQRFLFQCKCSMCVSECVPKEIQ